MRILFLTLLVLNLGFLGYHLAVGASDRTPDGMPPAGEGVTTLEPLPAREAGPAPDGNPPAGDVATSKAPDGGAGSADASTSSDPDDRAGVKASGGDGAASNAAAADAASQAESGEGERVTTPQPDATPPRGGGTDASASCYAVGPLSSGLLGRLESRVSESGITIVERWQGERVEPRYWVYLPPSSNMQGARERQQALAAAGYSDMLLVRNGEMALSISLGVFADEANATKHQQRLREDGFDARIREEERRTAAPYIGLRVPPTAAGDVGGLRTLLRDRDARLQERPCERLREE